MILLAIFEYYSRYHTSSMSDRSMTSDFLTSSFALRRSHPATMGIRSDGFFRSSERIYDEELPLICYNGDGSRLV